MICADTSSWIAYFEGAEGKDVELLLQSLRDKSLVLCPPVLTELLSNPNLGALARDAIGRLPTLELRAGFWERAGNTRADLLRRKFKPKLADTLIAQCCMDAGVSLITRDGDFLPFSRHAGLSLVLAFSNT